MSALEPNDAAEPSFEDALAELEQIVHELEEGQAGLAESLARYEQGVRLLKQCQGLLSRAERRIELLTGIDAEGNPVTVPVDDEASLSLDEKKQARSQRRSSPEGVKRRQLRKGSGEAPEDEMDEPQGLF